MGCLNLFNSFSHHCPQSEHLRRVVGNNLVDARMAGSTGKKASNQPKISVKNAQTRTIQNQVKHEFKAEFVENSLVESVVECWMLNLLIFLFISLLLSPWMFTIVYIYHLSVLSYESLHVGAEAWSRKLWASKRIRSSWSPTPRHEAWSRTESQRRNDEAKDSEGLQWGITAMLNEPVEVSQLQKKIS